MDKLGEMRSRGLNSEDYGVSDVLYTSVDLVPEGKGKKKPTSGFVQPSEKNPKRVCIGTFPGAENDFKPFEVDVKTLVDEGVHAGYRIIGVRGRLRLPPKEIGT